MSSFLSSYDDLSSQINLNLESQIIGLEVSAIARVANQSSQHTSLKQILTRALVSRKTYTHAMHVYGLGCFCHESQVSSNVVLVHSVCAF